jgi:hypothetical protein
MSRTNCLDEIMSDTYTVSITQTSGLFLFEACTPQVVVLPLGPPAHASSRQWPREIRPQPRRAGLTHTCTRAAPPWSASPLPSSPPSPHPRRAPPPRTALRRPPISRPHRGRGSASAPAPRRLVCSQSVRSRVRVQLAGLVAGLLLTSCGDCALSGGGRRRTRRAAGRLVPVHGGIRRGAAQERAGGHQTAAQDHLLPPRYGTPHRPLLALRSALQANFELICTLLFVTKSVII